LLRVRRRSEGFDTADFREVEALPKQLRG
jgi:hypothetical protein